jgi:hypothetical protein
MEKMSTKIIKEKVLLFKQITGLGKIGNDLLSHNYVVPLALWGLTSLFGMVRGGIPHAIVTYINSVWRNTRLVSSGEDFSPYYPPSILMPTI